MSNFFRTLFLVFLYLTPSLAAWSQVKTKSAIANQNNAVITQNGTGAITGEILNTLLGNIIYSYCGLAQSADCVLPSGVARANLGFLPLNPANNLSELTSVNSARSNLGLGPLATQSTINLSSQVTGSLAGNFLAVGAAVANLGYVPLSPFNNLSDLPNKVTARNNLGLGSIATLSANTLLTDSVLNYGASGSSQTTTGSISSGSTQLTVSSPIDFQVGQGIRILQAGATTTVAQVSLSSTSVVGTSGTTAYQYFICSLGYNGDYTGCQSASTTTGPNAIVYNGTTYYGSTQNYVNVNLSQGANSSGWVVYRSVNGGPLGLYTIGTGNVFKDQGIGWTSGGTFVGPDWLPSTPPSAPVNSWLVAKITAISGNVLTLSTPALQNVSGVSVYHDDTLAFNNAASAAKNASGANIGVPCGVYNISNSININVNYVGFTGNGMCSTIQAFGSGTDFRFPNTNVPAQQRGNFVQNFYIVDTHKNTGFTVYASNTFNILFQNLQVDFAPYGFYFLNNNSITLANVVGNSSTRGWASSWMTFLSDSTNYGCCLYATNVYTHGLGVYGGGATSIGGTDKQGFLFDGNFATAYGYGMAVSDIEGTGWNFVNDTGNPTPPYYLQFVMSSSEFSTNRSVNASASGTGPSDIYFTDSTFTGAQNNNSNVVLDSTTARIIFKGGKISNAGCRGIDIFGTQEMVIGVNIGNNSTPAAGGTNGACDGVVIEASSRGTVITGNAIGDPYNPTVQNVPVRIVNGADFYTITGNTFYGNVTNCPANGGSTAVSRVISGNAGSC